MTARTALLTALLALGLCGPAVALDPPPDPGTVTPEQIEGLKQQLQVLNQVQGMAPEQQRQFIEGLRNDPRWAKFAEQFKQANQPRPGQPPPGNVPPNFPQPQGNGPGRPPREVPQGIAEQPGPNPRPGPNPGPGPNPPPRPNGPIPNGPLPNGFNPNNANPPLDPRFNGRPDAAEVAKFWEKNFGPLDRTPAVRDAILELFAQGRDGGFDAGDWKDLLDGFNQNGGDNDFGDWLKDLDFGGGEKWDFGDWGGGWDFPQWGKGWNWGGGGGGAGGGGGGGWNWGGGGWGGGSGGGGGTWLPVILLVVVVVAALLLWKFWPMLARRESPAEAGVRNINRWPVDPRTVNSREELVKAFEYLSVLLCGDAARVWNHETIARALRQQIPHSDLVADELAKLYELARYTPPGEPLPPSALADARRCLCHLAGVTA